MPQKPLKKRSKDYQKPLRIRPKIKSLLKERNQLFLNTVLTILLNQLKTSKLNQLLLLMTLIQLNQLSGYLNSVERWKYLSVSLREKLLLVLQSTKNQLPLLLLLKLNLKTNQSQTNSKRTSEFNIWIMLNLERNGVVVNSVLRVNIKKISIKLPLKRKL